MQTVATRAMSSLFEEAQECLSARGGRMTAERRLILEALETAGGHPTAEELHARIKPLHPDLNLSTVYRTLRWLEGQGLVGAQRFSEDQRGDRFDPTLPAEHHHIVCLKCKQVIEFNHPIVEQLKRQLEAETGVLIESASIVLNGICTSCLLFEEGAGGEVIHP